MIPPVVDAAWLSEHPDVVVADVRWYLDGRSGQEAYDAGHIPGAVFVDLDRCLAGPASPEEGRHPLPDPEHFAAAMSRLGIGDGSRVVAYDDAGGTIAARLVWMLRVVGEEAALLDGGIGAYSGPRENSAVVPAQAAFTARAWPPDALAGVEAASDRSNVVLDARDPARYRGEHEPIDPRGGHIPGAVNLPCRGNLAPDGRFLPVEALRERFAAVGAGPDAIVYCGSGVTACHDLVALEHAGLGPGRLYAGSWSQYSADASRPAATGPKTG